MNIEQIIQAGKKVVAIETRAVAELSSRINDRFAQACHLMLRCKGRIVVTGMGKSGHIAGKIAATLASTGSPAFFVHPGEACHGDLGMITGQDVVLALSYSGETHELLIILPVIKRLGIPLIAMAGNLNSRLARQADVFLDVSTTQEACPHNLAPTSSTTAALVMGDALAIALLESRGFSAEDFARSHPGGTLGRRLLLHVRDIMHSGDRIPKVFANVTLADALVEMTSKSLGMTAIVDHQDHVLGVYTDGDLRRSLEKSTDPHVTRIDTLMTKGSITIKADILAAEAVKIMEQHKINGLLVVDNNNLLIGALNMHDLLRAGIV